MRLNNISGGWLRPLLVALIAALASAGAGGAEVIDSVVKIIAGQNSGTGFVWQGQRGKYIATSLHTLAGAERIYYDKPLARNELVVYRIDRESDLALLKPKSGELAHPALRLGNTEPVDSHRYWIYGFPAGVLTVQGDDIRFSRTRHNRPMNEYLADKTVRQITARGFPQPSVRLLRVSSGLTPGHSGAPIVDENDGNRVIGIGAGGLSHVGFRRVNWAVPAATYLPALESGGEVGDVAGLSGVPGRHQFGLSDEQTAAPIEIERSRYYHIDQVKFAELIDSMVDDGLEPHQQILSGEDLDEIYAEAERNGFDLAAPINVFQNSRTGTTVFIPAAIPTGDIYTDGDLVVVGSGRVQMALQLALTDSFDAAKAVNDDFVAFLDRYFGTRDWTIHDSQDDPLESHLPDQGYWSRSIYKYLESSDDEEISHLDIFVEIDYDDEFGEFLGVAVYGQNIPDFDASDEELLFLVTNCAWVSGFTLD